MSYKAKKFVTRYALTKGVVECDGRISSGGKYFIPAVVGWRWLPLDGADVHDTYESAREQAEVMRVKEIARLEKRLEKLKAMTF